MYMLEEDYFDMHMSEDSTDEMLRKACIDYCKAFFNADDLAKRVEKGILIDDVEGMVVIDNLILASRLLYRIIVSLGCEDNLPEVTTQEDFISKIVAMVGGDVACQ